MDTQTAAKIATLVTKLSALSDRQRLKVLGDLDRVFSATGYGWDDVAAMVAPVVWSRDDILAAIEKVEQHPDLITDAVERFFAKLKELVATLPRLKLTGRQADWLGRLVVLAEKRSQPEDDMAMQEAS